MRLRAALPLAFVLFRGSLAFADPPAAPSSTALTAPASAPSTSSRPATPGSAAPPTAKAIAEGRQHFSRAVDLFRDGDYRTALIEFRRASEVAPNFRILYNLGQTYFELQDYVGALRSFQAYLDQGDKQVPAARRTQVEADIEKLKARVAYVDVTTDPPGADVSIDDVDIGKTPLPEPVLVSAGRRKVTATLAGHLEATQTLDLAGGDESEVKLTLADATPAPPPAPVVVAPPPAPPLPVQKPSSPTNTPFWIAAGTTGALLVTTGVLALVTAGARRDYDSTLDRYPVTPDDVNDARTKVRTFALLTDIFGAATVLGGAATAYFTFRSPGKDNGGNKASAPTTQVGIRGTGLALTQTF